MSSDSSALPAAPLAPVKRRWFRFGLRRFVIGIVVLSATLAWIARERRQSAFERDFMKFAYQSHFGGPFDSAERTASHRRQGWWRDQARWLLGERIVNMRIGIGNQAAIVPSLARLTNLQQLCLEGIPRRTDLSTLEKLTDLRVLELNGYIENERFFLSRRHIHLHTLILSRCRFRTGELDLAPLAQLENLETLEIDCSRPYDLRPLSRIRNLTNLSLNLPFGCDLSPLAELRNLQRLSLSGEGVEDLSPLAKLSRLRHLDISGVSVRDLSPLRQLKSLEYIELERTPVHLADVDELRAALPGCVVLVGGK